MSRARARALVAGRRQESEGYRGEEDDWLWSLLGMWLQQHWSLAEDKGETLLSQRLWSLAKARAKLHFFNTTCSLSYLYSCNNVLAIGLEDAVYLWDAANESTKLLQPVEDRGPITCIRWSPDCAVLAVAFGNSDLALIDPATGHVVDGMEDENQAPVLSLAWRSNSILTVGRFDGTVVDYDFRKDDMFICFYNGHRRRVCSLKWSMLSGWYLASGGQDKLVHIWDACMPVSRDHPRQRQWLHRISSHTSIVKAVDWCPTRSNLLASGGGCNDNCVKFWNTINGACLNSIDVGFEVCALLWDKNKSELLTSHGSPNNQLTLWNYPSMTRVAEVSGHSSRVLSLAGSPLGGVVASAAADETIRFWNIFETPKITKPELPFAQFNVLIR
ncbi:unnamed protein product [Musa hybrid cultivar]